MDTLEAQKHENSRGNAHSRSSNKKAKIQRQEAALKTT